MAYMTDRKRASGLGLGRKPAPRISGQMKVSSLALVPLIPLFIFVFGNGLAAAMKRSLPITRVPSRPLSPG